MFLTYFVEFSECFCKLSLLIILRIYDFEVFLSLDIFCSAKVSKEVINKVINSKNK
jgi:hypothetical protein